MIVITPVVEFTAFRKIVLSDLSDQAFRDGISEKSINGTLSPAAFKYGHTYVHT